MQVRAISPRTQRRKMEKEEKEEKIIIFSDKPIGKDEKKGEDEFRHIVYADTIQKIIESFIAPGKRDSINIGLFGKWGSGKTSILNLLEKKIENNAKLEATLKYDLNQSISPKKLKKKFKSKGILLSKNAIIEKEKDDKWVINDEKKFIVRRRDSELEIYRERIKFVNFNAWKYSDESLRRQFLIFLDDNEKEGGLGTQIGVKDELYTSKESTKSKLTLSWLYLIITAALLFVIFSLTIFIEWIKDRLMLGSVLSVLVIIAFIGACLLTVLFETFKKEIIQKEQVTETLHRLDQPDQFEEKFKEIIKKAKKKWTKIVIAIDDIDRCREDKAIEMLRMIKTFLDEDDCIYIIPCDDEKIKKHLRTAMGYEEASEDADEFLRKFFQVVLRIPFSIRDNVESYTKKCTSEAGFEEDVGGVVVAAFWEDPRRIKQFINNLTALYELAKAKEREEEGEENLIEPRLVTSHFPFLAKIEAIRAKWPEIIEEIREDRGLLQTLQNDANNEKDSSKMQDDISKAWGVKWPEIIEKIREDRGLLQTLQNDANNEKDPSKMQDDISKAWDKGLKEFLKETRNVKGEEDWVSVFCDLGQPTYISAIPDGERFANLVLAETEERKENVKKIKKLIEDNSNFSIEDAELENELNEGLISEGLKNKFKTKKKITLSKTAALEKGKDNNWKVTDVERTYVIKKVHKKLNIYDTELKDRYTKVIRIICDKQRKKGNAKLAFNAFNVMVEICSADIEEGGKIIGDENRARIGKWVAEILDSDDMWGMIADKLNQNQLSKRLEEYVLISAEPAEVMRTFVSRIEKTKDIQKRALYSDVYFKLQKYDTIKSDFLNANLDIIKNVTSQPDDLIQLALDNLKRLKVLSPDKDKEVAEQLFDALKGKPRGLIKSYVTTLLKFRKMDVYRQSVRDGGYITGEAIRFREEISDFWNRVKKHLEEAKSTETEECIEILKNQGVI